MTTPGKKYIEGTVEALNDTVREAQRNLLAAALDLNKLADEVATARSKARKGTVPQYLISYLKSSARESVTSIKRTTVSIERADYIASVRL